MRIGTRAQKVSYLKIGTIKSKITVVTDIKNETEMNIKI